MLEHSLGSKDRVRVVDSFIDEVFAVKECTGMRRRVQQARRSSKRLHVVTRPHFVAVTFLFVGFSVGVFEENLAPATILLVTSAQSLAGGAKRGTRELHVIGFHFEKLQVA